MTPFAIRRPVVASVPMQPASTQLARHIAALCWLLICCAFSATAKESKTVDPFLQAAQWAEEVPTNEEFVDESDGDAMLECTDAVDCGDEIGMAGLIEPNRRLRSRWTVMAEMPILFPSYSTPAISTANEHPILGGRTSVGWESDRGFGIRGRFWEFDTAIDMDNAYLPSQQLYPGYYYNTTFDITDHQINFSGGKADLDFTKRVELPRGHFLFGASITAAQLELEETLTITETTSYSYYSYNYYGYQLHNVTNVFSHDEESLFRNWGVGLGLLAEGSHRFYESPVNIWSVFGRGRIAYLIGEWEQPYSSGLDKGDGNMTIGEAALGLEYRRKFRRADLIVQCAFEVQSWNVSRAGLINFPGVTPSVGLAW